MSINPLSGNAAVLKKLNRTRVLNNLRHNGKCSRTNLAGMTGLDKKTITNICNSLSQDRLIRIHDGSSKGKGRPPQIISLNPEAAYSIGIDVGSGHISSLLMDFSGEIISSFSKDSSSIQKGSVWETIEKSAAQLMEDLPTAGSHVEGIGICIPGLLDTENGRVIRSVNLKELEGTAVIKRLSEKFAVPVYLEEASRSMALAEIWYGGRSGADDFIVVDLGVGIGLGIVHQGRLYRGAHESSGELGHLVVQPGGKLCSCGKKGCLETVASGKAIDKATEHSDSEEKKRFIREAGSYAGMALANVINILDPHEIILQGGLINLGDTFLQPLKESAVRHALAGSELLHRIKTSNLNSYAGAMGAAILPLKSFFEMENISFN